jgi:hypothetical protein
VRVSGNEATVLEITIVSPTRETRTAPGLGERG